MPKLLVCRHVAFEILGTLDPLLRKAGFRIRYVNFGRHPEIKPVLDGYHGLVILGGPMNVDDVDRYPHLTTETRLVQEAIERDMPVLGICLGAQLVARALGARVRPNEGVEIGWYDVSPTNEGEIDPMLSHFQGTERLFQWHRDTFEIPDGAVRLATSTTCVNQAFRYQSNVYAFQFHLEVDEALIRRWLKVPIHVRELESLRDAIDPEQIRRQTPNYIDRLKQLSDQVFGSFIESFGAQQRRRVLPSR